MSNKELYITSRVVLDKRTECWLWTGTMLSSGYGRATWQTLKLPAHRFSLHTFRDFPLESDYLACHLCNVKRCVNPFHLYEGTLSTNCHDAMEAGNWVDNNGERSGLSNLTDEQATEIRERYALGCTQKSMAVEYGVHLNTIWRIINRKTYRTCT